MSIQHPFHNPFSKIVFVIALAGSFWEIGPKAQAEFGEEIPRIDMFNPMDVQGVKTIEGEVTRVQGQFVGEEFSQMKDELYVVRTPFGGERDLHFGETTQVEGNIFLGDHVQATVREGGLIQTIRKIDTKPNSSRNHNISRQVSGRVERFEGKFLFVKNGDRTEILHLDEQSTLEGDIREGTMITAQLGDAGYAIRIQKSSKEQGANPE